MTPLTTTEGGGVGRWGVKTFQILLGCLQGSGIASHIFLKPFAVLINFSCTCFQGTLILSSQQSVHNPKNSTTSSHPKIAGMQKQALAQIYSISWGSDKRKDEADLCQIKINDYPYNKHYNANAWKFKKETQHKTQQL